MTCLYVNKLSETEPLDFGILSPYLHIDYCETNGFEQHPSVLAIVEHDTSEEYVYMYNAQVGRKSTKIGFAISCDS